MKARIFRWDWRAQPDLDAMAVVIMELSETGPVLMRELPPGGDFYAWIVSDHPVTDEEAWELYRS